MAKASFTTQDLMAETLPFSASALLAQEASFEAHEPERVEAGRRLFAHGNCASCHGFSGQVKVGSRALVENGPFNFFKLAARLSDKTTRMFRATKKRNIRWQLTEAELMDLVAFLNTLPLRRE